MLKLDRPKLRHRAIKPIAIFLASFSLAFVSGSINFLPHPSSAETAKKPTELTVSSVISLMVTPDAVVNASTSHDDGYVLTVARLGGDSATEIDLRSSDDADVAAVAGDSGRLRFTAVPNL